MVVALRNRDGRLEPSKRFLAHSAIPQEMTTRSLDEFVMKLTQRFFDQLETETKLIHQDFATWEQQEGFKK